MNVLPSPTCRYVRGRRQYVQPHTTKVTDMAKKSVTQEQYVGEVRAMATFIGNQGAKVSEIARFLNSSPDHSPSTKALVEDVLAQVVNLVGCLKKLKELNVQRALTACDEEEARTLAAIAEKRRRVLEGTQRINRRASDEAAE